MTARVLLKGIDPLVDRRRIGVSYSGGGPLVVYELGAAQALVERGIIPDVVAGVSAGSLTAAAHALDVRGGRGIRMGADDVLARVSTHGFGLAPLEMMERVLREREHLRSLGDNAALGPLIAQGVEARFGLVEPTLGSFQPPGFPRLLVAATNCSDGTPFWFPESTPLVAALLASTAIPGVFPWQSTVVDGQPTPLVDGGVVANQPLSALVLQGCGQIYAFSVGYTGGALPPPTNALTNALHCLSAMQHQCQKLEEDYVRLKLGDRGVIHHLLLDLAPLEGYDFTPSRIDELMGQAYDKTVAWLDRGAPDEDAPPR
jgi:predicted acylesterase/phospholipase RssA